jgi:hypothetical protein
MIFEGDPPNDSGAIRAARTRVYILRHCEKSAEGGRKEAIRTFFVARWIASLALAMTIAV